MARKPQVDLRALKDEVADHLKKSRWDKAAEVLEDLVATEPKDMAQRLKLGEAYRRMGQPQKAIESYQHAAKFFADEGQLIKAIAAVKIVLEIDPRNAQALSQLGQMNERRKGSGVPLAKVSVTSRAAAPKAPPASLRPGPNKTPEAAGITNNPRAIELPPDDEATLELDDGRSLQLERPAPSARAAPPAPNRARSLDLPHGEELELDPAVPVPMAGKAGPIVPPAPGDRMLTPEL